MQATIGIDISKAHLDAHSLTTGTSTQFANNQAGRKSCVRWIVREGVDLVVFEPTGPYHQTLECLLIEHSIAFAKVNPRQVRRFAEAIGTTAKTDKQDAILLARMGAMCSLQATPTLHRNLFHLKELHIARQNLIKAQTATKTQAKTLQDKLLKTQNHRRLRQIREDIQEIDAKILKMIQTDDALARCNEILLTIPGIAQITATALLIEMPELGQIDAKQAASLAGLAPFTRQSGTWRGKSFIRGGRAHVRKALYMPALVAMRFNDDLKTVNKRLTKAGKPAKVAITAVMRKLLLLANALLRENRTWQKIPA